MHIAFILSNPKFNLINFLSLLFDLVIASIIKSTKASDTSFDNSLIALISYLLWSKIKEEAEEINECIWECRYIV